LQNFTLVPNVKALKTYGCAFSASDLLPYLNGARAETSTRGLAEIEVTRSNIVLDQNLCALIVPLIAATRIYFGVATMSV
jgi:hypothetical protein